jgi:hypothetical protein
VGGLLLLGLAGDFLVDLGVAAGGDGGVEAVVAAGGGIELGVVGRLPALPSSAALRARS